MAVTLNVGQSVTETATALDKDGGVDTAATITWTESSGGAVVALSGATSSNPSTVTVTYVGPGTSDVTATSVDPDGTIVAVGTDNPSVFTCGGVVVNTDAVAVNVVDGIPTP